MKVSIGAGVCVLIAGLLVASPAARQGSGIRGDIEKQNAAFVAALGKGDTAALAKLYSADAQAFPPNQEVVTGPAAIQKMWEGAISMGVKSAKLETTEVEAHGNMAHETGTYVMMGADGKTLDRGKYLVIWKKEGNAWKLHRDMWNTSMPAAH